jgi:hypothetical protein
MALRAGPSFGPGFIGLLGFGGLPFQASCGKEQSGRAGASRGCRIPLSRGLIEPVGQSALATRPGLRGQRGEVLDPAVQLDMVDLDSALGEQLLEIAVRLTVSPWTWMACASWTAFISWV